jgi:hypothetical protein
MFHVNETVYTFRMDFLCERGDFPLVQYNYSFISISLCKRPDDGSQLQSKHVAVNKLIKTSVECDWRHTISVATIAQLLSLLSFRYTRIMYYRLFSRSLLFLESPEDGCRKLLRNIGTYITCSRKLGLFEHRCENLWSRTDPSFQI